MIRIRGQFLATLAQAVEEHGLRVHGFCLMPNHYHLLVETPRAKLSRAVGWLQTTYTIRFNHRHRRSGHLFQGRFKAQVVEADSYAMELLRYVHLNPVRPRDKSAPVPKERRAALAEFPWSSHRAYLGRDPAPAWLCTDWLSFFAKTRQEGQREYARFVAGAFGAVLDSPWERLRFGLVLGGETFSERAKQMLKAKPGAEELRWVRRSDSGEARSVAARALAQREEERRWQVWVRVNLGGERRIDIAREYGYKDGSAITQILKRLELTMQLEPALRARAESLKAKHERALSRVKR